MKLLGLQDFLYEKLDSVAPDWRDLVDYEKVNEAHHGGLFDEIWLLSHLRDQFRASIYKKVSDKGGEMSEKIKGEGVESVLSAFKDFGGFAYKEIETLLGIESGISKLIREFEDIREFGASGGVDADLAWVTRRESEKLKESSIFWDKELLLFFKEVIDFLEDVDSSKKISLRELKDSQLALFRKEGERAVEAQKKLLNEDFLRILKTKLESSGDSSLRTTRDISLSSKENRTLLRKIKRSVSLEICNQQKLRTAFVNLVAEIIIGKSSSEELIEFIYSFSVLSSEQKSTLKSFILAGYVGFENMSDAFFGSSAPDNSSNLDVVKKCARKIFVDGIFYAIQEAEDDHKRRINAVYESQIYKVCNGGWWAGIAHVASFGFCTGYTVTAAAIDLIKGRLSGLAELRIIVQVIKFFIQLPPKITICELFCRIFKDAFKDILCEIVKEAVKSGIKSFEKKKKANEEDLHFQD